MTEQTAEAVGSERSKQQEFDEYMAQMAVKREATARELKAKLTNLFDWGTWRSKSIFLKDTEIVGGGSYDFIDAPRDSLLTGYLVPHSDITAGMVAKGKVDLAHEMVQRSIAYGIRPSFNHIWVGEGTPRDLGKKDGSWHFQPEPFNDSPRSLLLDCDVPVTEVMAFYSIYVTRPVEGEVWFQAGYGASTRAIFPLWSLGQPGVPSLAYFSRPVIYEPNVHIRLTLTTPDRRPLEIPACDIGFGFLVCRPIGVSVSDVT